MGLAILLAIVAELASIAIVADVAGWLWTLAGLALAAGLGMAVLANRGVTTLGRAAEAMQSGTPVGPVVVDGALVALAGVLLIIPGFVTDVVGLLLLAPPIRWLVRQRATTWLKGRLVMVGPGMGMPVNPERVGEVIDTTATEVRDADSKPPLELP